MQIGSVRGSVWPPEVSAPPHPWKGARVGVTLPAPQIAETSNGNRLRFDSFDVIFG
jgi:hypothetical protein